MTNIAIIRQFPIITTKSGIFIDVRIFRLSPLEEIKTEFPELVFNDRDYQLCPVIDVDIPAGLVDPSVNGQPAAVLIPILENAAISDGGWNIKNLLAICRKFPDGIIDYWA